MPATTRPAASAAVSAPSAPCAELSAVSSSSPLPAAGPLLLSTEADAPSADASALSRCRLAARLLGRGGATWAAAHSMAPRGGGRFSHSTTTALVGQAGVAVRYITSGRDAIAAMFLLYTVNAAADFPVAAAACLYYKRRSPHLCCWGSRASCRSGPAAPAASHCTTPLPAPPRCSGQRAEAGGLAGSAGRSATKSAGRYAEQQLQKLHIPCTLPSAAAGTAACRN